MRGIAAGLLVTGLLGMIGTTAWAQDATKAGGQSTRNGATAVPATAAAQPSAEAPTPTPVTLAAGLDFVNPS